MAESKQISIRLSNEILEKIDQQAIEEGKMIQGKPNRSLVIAGILSKHFDGEKQQDDNYDLYERVNYLEEKVKELSKMENYVDRLISVRLDMEERLELLEESFKLLPYKLPPSVLSILHTPPYKAEPNIPKPPVPPYKTPPVPEVNICWDEDEDEETPVELATNLTASQAAAFEKIINFIQSDEKLFRLSGYAGTEKSYLIAEVVKWCQAHRLIVTMASPTNKAAKNLRSMCQSQGLGDVEVSTVAQLLGIQPEINPITGKQEFICGDKHDSIDSNDVIFIDEFSMICKDNINDLLQAVNEAKIVFVGDDAQLPPINEKQSLVCDLKIPSAVLSEIVRYDGEIAKVAEEIRSNPQWNNQAYPFTTADDGTIIKLSDTKFITVAVESFKNDVQAARIIAYRNKTVDGYNKLVRQAIFGLDVEDYIIGDILIAKSPLFRKEGRVESILYNTSDEFTITGEKAAKSTKYLEQTWEYWEIPVNGSDKPLFVLTPEHEFKRQKKLEELAKKANEEKQLKGSSDI